MPQPAVSIPDYLATALPPLREAYPPGTGGTGPRQEWPEGKLETVSVIEGLEGKVKEFLNTIPSEPIKAHPGHKYPKFVQALNTVPQVLKAPTDLQKALSTLPLAGVGSMLTTLDVEKLGIDVGPKGAQAADAAGYESDGGVEPGFEESETRGHIPADERFKPYSWQFSKSPMGSGEFLLTQKGSDKVFMVVRTINSSAFSSHDWEEYTVSGKYRYNTKSKASWYWSRQWGASMRLGCQYYVLTDWQRWAFGVFDEERKHGYVSPVWEFGQKEPSVMQALFYWARSAIGDANGFQIPSFRDSASSNTDIFPDNPARRVSVTGSKPRPPRENKVKAANESDIEESDAEDA